MGVPVAGASFFVIFALRPSDYDDDRNNQHDAQINTRYHLSLFAQSSTAFRAARRFRNPFILYYAVRERI